MRRINICLAILSEVHYMLLSCYSEIIQSPMLRPFCFYSTITHNAQLIVNHGKLRYKYRSIQLHSNFTLTIYPYYEYLYSLKITYFSHFCVKSMLKSAFWKGRNSLRMLATLSIPSQSGQLTQPSLK